MIKFTTSCAIILAIVLSSTDGLSLFQKQSKVSTPPNTENAAACQQTTSATAAATAATAATTTPSVDRVAFGSRRESFVSMMSMAIGGAAVLSSPRSAFAAADCMKDCVKNCLLIAPKDKEYCTDSCTAYCAQDDRTDGLSGSVSAANGEVGILGGSFGQGTVPKGEDKPPSIALPGLDFSSDKGKKLLGY